MIDSSSDRIADPPGERARERRSGHPRLGITTGIHSRPRVTDVSPFHGIDRSYLDAVVGAGGVPFPLPNLDPSAGALIDALLEPLDGLILSGGGDLAAHHFGQEPHPRIGPVDSLRDAFEIAVTNRALARGLPILGICRGAQILNVAAGGTIHQDLASDLPGTDLVAHDQTTRDPNDLWHRVAIEPGSRLARHAEGPSVLVNSYHHQANARVADGFRVTARAADGVVEAIEAVGDRFAVGVQWHPEMIVATSRVSAGVFADLVEAARACTAVRA